MVKCRKRSYKKQSRKKRSYKKQSRKRNFKGGSSETKPVTKLCKVISQNKDNQTLTNLDNSDINNPCDDKKTRTPMYFAIRYGNLAIVKLLYKNGANLKQIVVDSNSNFPIIANALHVAVKFGKIDIVNYFLNEDNFENIFIKELLDEKLSDDGDTPLYIAAVLGYKEIVEVILKNKNLSTINEGCNNGRTALHIAIIKGHTEIVQLFLDFNDDIEFKGFDNDNSPKCDIDKNDNDGNTPLHIAIQENHLNIVNLLLEKPANISAKNNAGNTPLHIAIQKNHLNIVKLLFEKRANLKNTYINIQNKNGYTPLIMSVGYAKKYKNLDIFKFILNENLSLDETNLDETDNEGYTALHWAIICENNNCETSNVEIFESLLYSGANINSQNNFSETPLHLALMNRLGLFIILLLYNGANFNNKDNNGKTQVEIAKDYEAKDYEDEPVIYTLLDRGANLQSSKQNLMKKWKKNNSEKRKQIMSDLIKFKKYLLEPGKSIEELLEKIELLEKNIDEMIILNKSNPNLIIINEILERDKIYYIDMKQQLKQQLKKKLEGLKWSRTSGINAEPYNVTKTTLTGDFGKGLFNSMDQSEEKLGPIEETFNGFGNE